MVLTTGTFLRGLIHIGEQQTPAGRVGEAPAIGLSPTLERIGFALGRLKTGTPPRLDGRTIDWARLEMQPGDDPPEPFSALTERIAAPQVACAITRTTAATHAIIRANVHRSPMYSGQIQSRGPRYCPSVEDKIVRFGERDGHQIFLEPEGLDDPTVYPNGISTSLPEEVQRAFVATIPGLERASIIRPGYAIEYDHVDPRELQPDAGNQAAAGPVSGRPDQRHNRLRGGGRARAGRRAQCGGSCRRRRRNLFDRAQGYLGVMIDDLVSRGVTEPYRMFTSRAEFRLTLRADNADQRLTDARHRLGCVGRGAGARLSRQRWRAEEARERTRSLNVTPARPPLRFLAQPGRPAAKRVRAPVLSGYRMGGPGAHLAGIPWPCASDRGAGRDRRQICRLPRAASGGCRCVPARRGGRVPAQLDYAAVPGLSNECPAEARCRAPRTIGHASRIDGITPAALTLLAAHVRRGRFGNAKRAARS